MRGMTRAARNQSGVVAVNLVLVIAFALFAVIMLTRTTVAASSIDDRVKKIRSEVGKVDEELTMVPQLDQTSATASQINDATRNLSRQADEIRATAQSIDRTVSSILSNATSINGTVGSIQSSLGGIQSIVRSIDAGVAAINGRVETVRRHVNLNPDSIKNDTANVVAQVGLNHGGSTIHGHANGIECATALQALPPNTCGLHP